MVRRSLVDLRQIERRLRFRLEFERAQDVGAVALMLVD